MAAEKKPEQNWSVGFCKFYENVPMFLFALCVPCGIICMQAANAEVGLKADKAYLVACICGCMLGCWGTAWNRTNLRIETDVDGTYIVDFVLHWFVSVCAVTQEWQHVMKKIKGNQKLTICNFNTKEPETCRSETNKLVSVE